MVVKLEFYQWQILKNARDIFVVAREYFLKNALWRTVHLKVLKSEIFMDKKSFTGEKKKSTGRCQKLLRCRKVGNGWFLRRRLVSTSFLSMVKNVQFHAQELEK